MRYSPTEIARQFPLKEAGQNKGQRVEAIQHWSGGIPGQSWCCYFATFILDVCFELNAPIPRLGACQDVYNMAKAKGWLVDKPVNDDLFLYVNDQDHAHHVGIITNADENIGIAGNTSADGVSSNGDGVYEHKLISNPAHIKYVHYPR